jgi:hypothetical protein
MRSPSSSPSCHQIITPAVDKPLASFGSKAPPEHLYRWVLQAE